MTECKVPTISLSLSLSSLQLLDRADPKKVDSVIECWFLYISVSSVQILNRAHLDNLDFMTMQASLSLSRSLSPLQLLNRSHPEKTNSMT